MRTIYITFLIFFVFLSNYTMFTPDQFFNDSNGIKKLQKLQAFISAKKNKLSSSIPDEILLPGDFLTIVIDNKTFTTIQNEGKKIIQKTKDFIQEKTQNINLVFESLSAFKECGEKRQNKLIKLRNHKPAIKDKPILKIANPEPFQAWDSIKKNKNTIMFAAAATTALLLLMVKTMHNEKTDEELLEEFNNTINNKQISKNEKMKLVRQVMHRLIDPNKDIPLQLLYCVLDQSDNNNRIINTALTTKREKYSKFLFNILSQHTNRLQGGSLRLIIDCKSIVFVD